jgi:methylenetetrahydrofolate reductase (NADPH)
LITFKEALRTKDFVVTVELPLSPDSTPASITAQARSVEEYVDGYIVTDNQYGQPHMSPAAASGILLQNGFAPILQLSCRNRNRIALIGELLGARASGIESLMLVRGGVLPEGYSPRPKAVVDTDAKELIATARIIDQNERLGNTDEMLIGTSATVHTPAPGSRPAELLAKADAGARLIIAQICHDPKIVRRYMEFLVENKLMRRLSVIISIAIPGSVEVTKWLVENRRGTVMGDAYMHAIETAEDTGAAAIEFAGKMVAEYASIPGVSGVNFAAVSDLGTIPHVLEVAGIGR